MTEHRRILSGIQPTGNLHLGNYLGAVKNWVAMQRQAESLFCVVDLHAITTPQDPKELFQNTREAVAIYLASGVDAEKSFIFPQSAISGHSELMWILACHTPLGWLNRMTQFKEKAGKRRENAVLGLYAYPVLMAADILLYGATDVPVGHDQKQHLELTRDIAKSFNIHYGAEILVVPEPRIMGAGKRVMSLRDGTSKMSKSDPSEFSRIHLKDDADTIELKIQKARTDSSPFPSNAEELEGRPEAENLINICLSLTEGNQEEIFDAFGGKNFSEFKKHLTGVCVDTLGPIRERFSAIMDDAGYLDQIIQRGTEKAASIAHETLSDIKEIVGLFRGV